MSRFYSTEQTLQKKNERSQNLKGLINGRTEDEEDNNIEVLRRKIHRNRKFINKVRIILNRVNLKEFIIEETDSVITQKKKIRHLSEMVTDDNPTIFSSQLNQYIRIYSDHCSQILRMPLYQDQQHCQELVRDKAIPTELDLVLCEPKELNKSLKFIDLNKPEEELRETKGINWISMPQFITHGGTRKTKMEEVINKITRIESSHENWQQKSPGKAIGQVLIQKDLEDKITVETPALSLLWEPAKKIVKYAPQQDPF